MIQPVQTRSHESVYDWSTTRPSIAIIDSIAALENEDPLEMSTTLEMPLYEYVNPEALDALITEARRISVSLSVGRYSVDIDGDR